MPSPLRVGIVGCGNIVRKHHLPNLLQHPEAFRVVAVCDVVPSSVDDVGRACNASVYRDYREMLERESLDAVLVATPHHLHAGPVLLAAQRGVHVLLEKPMATTLADCERMVDACAAAGVTFMVAENERYKANIRAAGKLVHAGDLGELRAIRSEMHGRGDRRHEPHHWIHDPTQAGGGIVLALAIHRLDVMRWLAGEVQVVSACFDVATALEKVASVQLRFASGAIGHFLAAEVPAPPPKSGGLVIMGSRGTIGVMLPGSGYHGPPRLFLPDHDEPITLPMDATGLESEDAFDAELLHFASCVRSGLHPHTSGRDNLQTMRMVFAIYQSARTGQAVDLSAADLDGKGTGVP